MRSLLNEIREQPEHIRQVFMWTFVVVVFSVIGFTWFNSTQKQFVALLNPDQAAEQRILAENKEQPKSFSPFAMIGNSFNGFKASVVELFLGIKTTNFEVNNKSESTNELPPQELPILGDKKK